MGKSRGFGRAVWNDAKKCAYYVCAENCPEYTVWNPAVRVGKSLADRESDERPCYWWCWFHWFTLSRTPLGAGRLRSHRRRPFDRIRGQRQTSEERAGLPLFC